MVTLTNINRKTSKIIREHLIIILYFLENYAVWIKILLFFAN